MNGIRAISSRNPAQTTTIHIHNSSGTGLPIDPSIPLSVPDATISGH